MPNPAQVYLHVGFHKTGTTTLQSQFAASRRQLQRNGVLYPKSLCKSPGHHEIAWAFLKPDWANNHYDAQAVLAHYRDVVAGASQPKVVLSSEDLILLTRNPASMAAIRDAFTGHRVQVVVYIRDVFSHLASAYRQALYAKRETRAFGQFVDGRLAADKYVRQLRAHADCFGRENLIIQRYDGDTVGSFLRLLGVNVALRRQVKRQNASLHPHFTEAVLHINRNDALSDETCKAMIGSMRDIEPAPPPVDSVRHYWQPHVLEQYGERLQTIRSQLFDEFGIEAYGEVDAEQLMKAGTL